VHTLVRLCLLVVNHQWSHVAEVCCVRICICPPHTRKNC